MAAQNEMLRALQAKSCRLNGAFQRFQSEIKVLFRDLLQSDLDANQQTIYESKIKKLFNEYSFDINRLETEYFVKCESLINGQSTKSVAVSSNQLKQSNHSDHSEQIEQINSKLDANCTHNHNQRKRVAAADKTINAPTQHHRVSHVNDSESTNQMYQCRLCDRSFPTKSGLGGHMTAHRRPKTIAPARDSKADQITSSSGHKHQCTECHRSFSEWNHFAIHCRNVHSGYPYSCDHPQCDQEFKYQRELIRHQNSAHHRDSDHRCSSSDFADDESEDNDLEMNGIVEREWRCDCGKRFKNENGLHSHVREDHGGKPLTCTFCGELFAYKRELTVHLRSEHAVETQSNRTTTYSTGSSGSVSNTTSLSSNSLLQSESDVDSDNFQCKECGKKLMTLRGLRNHEKLHLAHRPFPCHLCDKGFVLSDRLNYHLVHCHDYKPYQCMRCQRRFTKKCEMTAHEEGCGDGVVSGCDVVSENEDVVMSNKEGIEQTVNIPVHSGVRSIVNHRL